MMLAAVGRRYGAAGRVTLADVPKPEPRDDGDPGLGARRPRSGWSTAWPARGFAVGTPGPHFGALRPRFPVLGCDFAGDVEAAGPLGQPVRRGRGGVRHDRAPGFGAHASTSACPSRARWRRSPFNVSYGGGGRAGRRDGAVLPAGQDGLRPGQTVLVNGASGAVGSAAVQLAVHIGATVAGVCSGPHMRLVRKLGAESVVDYTRTDFARARAAATT